MSTLQIRLQSMSVTRIPVKENPSSWWGSSLSPSSSSNYALHWCPRVSVGRRLVNVVISSRRSLGSFGKDRRWSGGEPHRRDDRNNNNDDYIEAFLLLTETARHHNLRNNGFVEEAKWNSVGQFLAVPIDAKDDKSNAFGDHGHGFFQQFQNPTVFLKIACDGEFWLPIIVGEFAIERLINSVQGDQEECPDQFDVMKNVVEALGYEVRMVRITERILNTYYAHVHIGKVGEQSVLSLDSTPSDAINLANRCKVPIYVNRKIVSTDAIQVAYGRSNRKETKSIYDVLLDSATEGPDPVAEELHLVKKLNRAVMEERYGDAALWRDRLAKLRLTQNET